ncbi:PREDICTED: uncharacterized protein LOC109168586 [Ipomoea nil]|uniref:uncharacterized protein LOC109158425 n=1 Tax=Ipomoea nil TaxID=35883 RepID=UPI00090187AD|nr:PREDICTED: uncharacterized protein LOC109158425 [Ipomoea nil]XP_019173187.1 PREDICTED: uncharacterized protein LOC109168586 [Ipomoea nil]
MEVKSIKHVKWNLAIIYVIPTKALKRSLWRDLGKDVCKISQPWLAIGDFNSVLSSDEVIQTTSFNDQRSRDFVDWVNQESLIDMRYKGPTFTWKRGNNSNTFRGARLDRGLCSDDWLDIYPSATISHLPNISSNHNQILLGTTDQNGARNQRRFQFQASWTARKDFMKVINNVWNSTTLALVKN